MKPEDFSKVFDISKPRPSSTSRPVIVGHQPTMTDPMVNRPATPQAPAVSQPPPKVAVPDGMSYQAKTVEVSDQMRQEIASARAPLADVDVNNPPPVTSPAPSPQAVPAVQALPAVPPLPAEGQPPAAMPVTPDPLPSVPVISPTDVPVAPGQTAPLPNPTASAGAQASPQPAVEPHFQSLPVSHEPVSGSRLMRRIAVWFIVALLLAAVAAYLLIDAGIINANVNLPVHIINRST